MSEVRGHGEGQDLEEFFRFLTAFVPRKSIDGARWVIDNWAQWAQKSEFREKAILKWQAMDRLLEKTFESPPLKPDPINDCICRAIPEAFSGYPVWASDSIRVAGREVSASELFKDPFTCLLAWCGILGIHEGRIVPGYIPNQAGGYVYESLLGSMANFGHLFSNPAWRFAVVGEIAKHYNLDALAGEDMHSNISASQDEVDAAVLLLKKVMAWGQDQFREEYACMPSADSFYAQCLYSYNPAVQEQQVRSTTSGAVIPIERYGGKSVSKHCARGDYFDKGLLGPGAENIHIYYQWDRDTTAKKLAQEQAKAEQEGRGAEHKREAIAILARYLIRPNIELSEGSFSGPWGWKNYFTLVSNERVAFSGRDETLKRINHGLWVDHEYKPFLTRCIRDLTESAELTTEQKALLQAGLPDAKRLHEVTMLLYRVENKRVLKPRGTVIEDALAYAAQVVEELLQRGRLLMRTA